MTVRGELHAAMVRLCRAVGVDVPNPCDYYSFAMIGRALGRSRNRAWQHMKRALRFLHYPRQARLLRPLIDGPTWAGFFWSAAADEKRGSSAPTETHHAQTEETDMTLGNNHVTTTTAANFIPELWALDVLEAAEHNLVMAGLVTRFDDVAAEGGDVIHVPRVSNFAAQSKQANAQVQPQSTAEDKVSIALANHKEVSFLIEDIVAVQAKSSLREIYTKKAGHAIAKAIDEHLLGLYAGLSQVTSAIGNEEQIGIALLGSMRYLDQADAPADERFLVVSPSLKAQIMGLANFTSREYIAPSDPNAPMQTGLFGEILGARVFMSNNIAQTTESGVTTYHNIMFARGAFALAIQLGPRVQANYVPEYLGTLVTVDVIYGYTLLNASLAVDVLSQ